MSPQHSKAAINILTPITLMTTTTSHSILTLDTTTTTCAITRSVHPTHSANQIAVQLHTAMQDITLTITITIITAATTILE